MGPHEDRVDSKNGSGRFKAILLTLFVIGFMRLLMSLSGSQAWATPGQDTLHQTIPTPTPTPCGPIEVAGGVIGYDTTWYQACSPYIVSGNVLVSQGVTLTIEAGVEVKFANNIGLQVNGTLIARGTPTNHILFTSNQPSPSAGDWISIFFASPSADATFDTDGNYIGGSILEYCEVHYGGGSGSSGTIRIESSAPYINHSTISNGASNGLYIYQGSPRISNSVISNNAQRGIHIYNYPGGGTVTVSNNTIRNNTQDGIYAYLYGNQTATFSGNLLQSNGGAGIRASSGWLTIASNNVDSNSGGGINLDGEGCTNAQISNNTITNNSASTGGGINANPGWCGTTTTISGNTITNNQANIGGALNVSGGGRNRVYIRNNTIENNTATSNAVVYFNGSNSDEFVHNLLGGNVDNQSPKTTLYVNGLPTINYNDLLNPSNTFEIYNKNSSGGGNLDAAYNWWGTTDASIIAEKIYDFEDDSSKGLVDYSPLLGASSATPPTGPGNPSVSITAQGGTTQDPIFTLALSADATATQMLISDDYTFPSKFQWEPFTTTKQFHTSGTNYIYAKFKDASDNESAIAFAKPPRATSGEISTNTTWTSANSPYEITGNLLVKAGVTLTIEAGVEVKFANNIGLQVNGTLIARGTPTNHILFTSNQPSPSAGDWISIFFASPSADATFDTDGNYIGGSILEYCEVHYGGGSGSSGTIRIESSAPYINHSTISNGASNGLYIYQGSPRISNSVISNNAQRGIHIYNYPGGGTVTVSNNTIRNNTQDGIYAYLYGNQTATFSGNLLQSNGGAGIRASSGWLTIASNNVDSNSGGGINLDGEGCTNAQISNNTITNNSASTGGGINANPGWCGTTTTISGNTITNNQANIGGALNVSGGGRNRVYIRNNTIENNTATSNAVVYFNGSNSDEFVHNLLGGNVDNQSPKTTLYVNGLPTINYNDLLNPSNTFEIYNKNSSGGGNLDAAYNWWGTTDASIIAEKIYDFEDDFSKGLVDYSPLLGASSATPPTGPGNPSVSITAQGGTTQDPIFTLALSADTSATQMLISDDYTFPSKFQWEPFATTKQFHTSGTNYIYAKFKDASGNESAIAFAKPPRILYIQKNTTLAGHPALIQARVASDLAGTQQLSAASVASGVNVKTFYRPIGSTDYTKADMTLTGGVYSAWIPANIVANGVEYYLQVEDSGGQVLATLPESNPADNPFSMSATNALQQSVQANAFNAFELAIGLSFEIPTGALSSNTSLQVSDLSTTPAPPAGIKAADVGFDLSMANGTSTFSRPISITFCYADSDVTGMNPDNLRVYYLDNGISKFVGGTPNTNAHTVQVSVNHFSDFFLGEGSEMYPAPVTRVNAGDDVTIQASVVDYVPVYSATLHYKPGTGNWTSLTMVKNGDTYQATIPGSQVTPLGLSYYIVATDGTTTVTYPTTNPQSSPQTITVLATAAPQPVSGITASTSGGDLHLDWPAVTQDVNGNPTAVEYYTIYRGDKPNFTPDASTKLLTITGTSYVDTGVLNNTSQNYYYVILAVDNANHTSSPGDRMGVARYTLEETPSSDYAWIGLSLENTSLSGGSASDLWNYVESHSTPSVTVHSISRYDPVDQNYQTYLGIPGINDFALSVGEAYRIEATTGTSPQSIVMTLVGKVPSGNGTSYTLVSTPSSDYNWIVLPPSRSSLSDAASLKADIESTASPPGSVTVRSISRYDAVNQSFQTYITGDINNFSLSPGESYRLDVDVSGNSASWP